jgi:hypothetical protein
MVLNLCVFKILSDHMSNFPRSAALEKSRERSRLVDILKQQMLDLEALRKKVAEAESRASVHQNSRLRA